MQDLPIHSGDVPVFDCHVIISGPDEHGQLHGVVSNLPEVTAAATNERDLLRRIASEFKVSVQRYRNEQRTIPWQDTQKPGEGQVQRWIPVHL